MDHSRTGKKTLNVIVLGYVVTFEFIVPEFTSAVWILKSHLINSSL